MTSQEWNVKYNKMVALANDLFSCPYYKEREMICKNCPIFNKCRVVGAIITLSKIKQP